MKDAETFEDAEDGPGTSDASDESQETEPFSICKQRPKVALSKRLAYGPPGAAILPSSVLLLFLSPLLPPAPTHVLPSFFPSRPRLQEKGDDKCGGRTMLLVTAVITTAARFHLRHTHTHTHGDGL